MKHLSTISQKRRRPSAAMSVIELDGLFQKLGRTIATLTSAFDFFRTITHT